jgi:peroxiredoxin
LNKDRAKFEAAGAVLVPILADNEAGAKQLASTCDDCQIPIYFDQKKAVVKELHQEVAITKLGRMPAILIADKQGIIRYAYFGDSMSDIPTNDELLAELEKLNT